jgi:hypothetical protein
MQRHFSAAGSVVLFGAVIAAGLAQRWGDEGEAPPFGARQLGQSAGAVWASPPSSRDRTIVDEQ